jgi:hypothetical protein
MSLCDSSSGSSFHVSGAVLKRCGVPAFLAIGCGSSDKSPGSPPSDAPDGANGGAQSNAGGTAGKSGGGAGGTGGSSSGGVVAGLELQGQINGPCTFVPGATGTLYIADSQSNVAFGGSTLGALLGPTNFDVTGQSGANNGWAIPLSGDTNAVRLP